VSRTSFLFGETHRGDLRLTEYGERNTIVIRSPGPVTENGVGKSMAFVDRDRRQVKTVCDVSYCVDVIARCARIAINGNRAASVEMNANTFQA
jgi:hypothetical protein